MKRINKKNAGSYARYVILVAVSVLLLFPFVYMLANSFTTAREASAAYSIISGGTLSADQYIGFKLIPEQFSLIQYYDALLRRPKFLVMFWNSVIMTVPIVMGQLLVASLAAFAFSKLRFPFRDQLFFVYIIVMLMPFQVTLVPNFIIEKNLNLLGSYASVILPGIFSTFGVFLLRQFMMYIPQEYCEAANIDGTGYFRLFTNIVLPNCKSALASMAILVFVDNWNMVEQPLVFLSDENMRPLSIFLNKINESEIGIAFACGIIYMIPTLLIFLYGENYFIEGIQLSGIK